MKRRSLETVRRVRELAERERLADQARARRAADDARAELLARQEAHAGEQPPSGEVDVAALRAHRVAVVARGDAADRASETHAAAEAQHATATERTVEAAIARRSTERLIERRRDLEAAAAVKLEERRRDDVGLQLWRRHR